MIDAIFNDMEECIWYFDDILIYSGNTKAKHQAIVEKVLQQCIEHRLVGNWLKREFYLHKTIFLVHVINKQEVEMESSKLETMSKWPIPTKKKEVQAVLGFANYYSQYIVNYGAKACLFINLTQDVPSTRGYTQQQAFDKLAAQFFSTTILIKFNRTLERIIETNASNYTIAGILFQYYVVNGYKQFHSVEYYSKTLPTTEYMWPIHNKELFAIVACF